jgi:hypothetical protein
MVGAWMAGNVQGYQGSEWATYLLFGPEATWASHPTPLRSSGLRSLTGSMSSARR